MGRLKPTKPFITNRCTDEDLEKRFSYLPKEERNKLIYGDDFVEVPRRELERLKIDA